MNGYASERAKMAAAALIDSGADAFVIINDEDSNWESLFYLSGFRGTSGALIIYPEEAPELILDSRYAVQGREQSPHEVICQKEGLLDDVAFRLAAHGAENALCEAGKTLHSAWSELNAFCPLSDGGEIIRALRRAKDASETADIRRSAEIGAKAFLEALDSVKPGMTEKEFEALLNYRINMAGGAAGFDMIVASGPRSVMPHGRASDRAMQAGEWVTVDFGARYNGYFCDITRNFSIGAPSEKAAALHALITDAHMTAAAELRPGASGPAVHNTALKVLDRDGLGKYFTHGLGHGIGLELHEAPRLSSRKDDILKAGDVVTVEPGLYIPDLGGMRLEDDYLITKDGAERLTASLNQRFYTV